MSLHLLTCTSVLHSGAEKPVYNLIFIISRWTSKVFHRSSPEEVVKFQQMVNGVYLIMGGVNTDTIMGGVNTHGRG